MFILWFLQYDIELYQRIEQLIGKKLPLYQVEDEEVMCLQERVSEAQRLAKMVNITNLNIFLLFIFYNYFEITEYERYGR